MYDNYKECLYNGGLKDNIEIVGKTATIGERGKEILEYLEEHKEIENFIILDDESYGIEKYNKLKEKFIQTETYIGINWGVYEKAKLVFLGLLKKINKGQMRR